MKSKMLFISRHEATASQVTLAAKAGYQLVAVGDLDAFAGNLKDRIYDLTREHGADAVACVHALIAMSALGLSRAINSSCWFAESIAVGVFENTRREDGSFEAGRLHVMHAETPQEERSGCAHTVTHRFE